jgi:hypothetical protein
MMLIGGVITTGAAEAYAQLPPAVRTIPTNMMSFLPSVHAQGMITRLRGVSKAYGEAVERLD